MPLADGSFDGGISFRRQSGHHGSKNYGGSTSVHGRVRSPHISGGSRYSKMPPVFCSVL